MANDRPRFPHLKELKKVKNDDLFVVRQASSGHDKEIPFIDLARQILLGVEEVENTPWGVVEAVYVKDGSLLDIQGVVKGNEHTSGFRWVIYRQPTSPDIEIIKPGDAGSTVEASGEVDSVYGVINVDDATPLLSSDRFWLGVWFYEKEGFEGVVGGPILIEVELSDKLLVKRPPWLLVIVDSESTNLANYAVRLRDPDGLAELVESRVVIAGGAPGSDTGWVVIDSPPNIIDFDVYNLSEILTPGKLVTLSFRVRWRPPGAGFNDWEYVVSQSRVFGSGAIPGNATLLLTLQPRIDFQTGWVSTLVNGTEDLQSFRINAALSPISQGALEATGAIDGLPADVMNQLKLSVGQTAVIQGIGYTGLGGSGTPTPMVTAKITFGISRQPRLEVTALRQDDNVTVTIAASDLSLAITTIQYRKWDVDETPPAYSNFAGPGNVGTIGVDQSLLRIQTVVSPDGNDASFQWRVQFTDEEGNTKALSDIITLANLREITKKVTFSHTQTVPYFGGPSVTVGTEWSYSVGYLSGAGPVGNANLFGGAMFFPPGVILEEIRLRCYKASGSPTNSFIELELFRVSDTGSGSLLATLTPSSFDTWVTVPAALSETVGLDNYSFRLFLNPGSGGVPASDKTRFNKVEIWYAAPGYHMTY